MQISVRNVGKKYHSQYSFKKSDLNQSAEESRSFAQKNKYGIDSKQSTHEKDFALIGKEKQLKVRGAEKSSEQDLLV